MIILKDIKHMEIEALLKFMYQGEVSVKREDLPTFLKMAQIFQIKGLEDREGQIMPMINNYVNASHAQCNSKNVNTLSDINNEQSSKRKLSDGSASSHKMSKRNLKKKKRHLTKDENDSVEQPKDDININNSNISNDIYLLSDDDQNANDSESENSKYEIEDNDSSNHDETIPLTNQLNSNDNLMQSGTIFYCIICYIKLSGICIIAKYVKGVNKSLTRLTSIDFNCIIKGDKK